jgi:hypothetical protein
MLFSRGCKAVEGCREQIAIVDSHRAHHPGDRGATVAFSIS